MPQQQNLFQPGTAKAAAVGQARIPRIPGWLRIVEFILFIVLRVYVGIIVLLLPWTKFWSDNSFLNHWPAVAVFLSYGAVRGVVSGLGLLNLWIAVSETFHNWATRS